MAGRYIEQTKKLIICLDFSKIYGAKTTDRAWED